MEGSFFLVRHTIFWSVPLFLIAGETAYRMWLRKKKKSAIFCMVLAGIGFAMTFHYVWAGGPEKSVKSLIKAVHFLGEE